MDEFLVYYDDQCEVCQAGVSWLRFLDRRHLVHPIALSSARLPPGLLLEDCLRETPRCCSNPNAGGLGRPRSPGTIVWPDLGHRRDSGVPPFSWLGRILYRRIARNRYAVSRCRGGACGSAKPAEARVECHLFYSLGDAQSTRVTDGVSDATNPLFDRDDKYLYFTASTNSGESLGLDIHAVERTSTSSIYLAVLDKTLPSPFAPESDEERAADDKKPADGDKPDARSDTPPADAPRPAESAKPKPEAICAGSCSTSISGGTPMFSDG